MSPSVDFRVRVKVSEDVVNVGPYPLQGKARITHQIKTRWVVFPTRDSQTMTVSVRDSPIMTVSVGDSQIMTVSVRDSQTMTVSVRDSQTMTVSVRNSQAVIFLARNSQNIASDQFRYPFHPRFTAVARKRPRSAESAGGRLQLNTHTPYVCGFA